MPYNDSDMTVVDGDILHLAPEEEDMWFVVKAQDIKVPIRGETPLSVGRDEDQEVVLPDRTVSRRHLVISRENRRVEIRVLGRNGLDMNGRTYKDQTVACTPPKNFRVGNVTCGIETSDDTVIITNEDKSPIDDTRRTPSKPRPQIIAKPERFIERDRPVESRYAAAEPPITPANNNFAPEPVEIATWENKKWYQQRANLWIALPCAMLLVLAVFFLIPDIFGPKVQDTHGHYNGEYATDPSPVYKKPGSRADTGSWNRYLIETARELMATGRLDEARDHLLDISKGSAFYEQARKMITEIDNRQR